MKSLKPYPHKFNPGDPVQMKIDGRAGTVIRTWDYFDDVSVRFAGTDYQEIKVHEFELEFLNGET